MLSRHFREPSGDGVGGARLAPLTRTRAAVGPLILFAGGACSILGPQAGCARKCRRTTGDGVLSSTKQVHVGPRASSIDDSGKLRACRGSCSDGAGATMLILLMSGWLCLSPRPLPQCQIALQPFDIAKLISAVFADRQQVKTGLVHSFS